MKRIKQILCILLSLLFIFQTLTGCSGPKNDETLFITKGEFFSYFVYENSLSSDKYTADDIQNCEDGSVEANIIAEWGYLPAELATSGLSQSVTKETVVMVCANATFDLKKGNTSDIKDADLLKEPELIADAYASGFFELENGYFDGAQHMSFADCDKIMNKAKEYTAAFHYEANTEVTKTAEGVKEQDGSKYKKGDIVIEFLEDESGQSGNSNVLGTSTDEKDIKAQPVLTTGSSSTSTITLAKNKDYLGINKVKGFSATIAKTVFEKDLKNPQIGDTVILEKYDTLKDHLSYGEYEVIGILTGKKLINNSYNCLFEYPEFEPAVEKKNVEKANDSGIDIGTFVKDKTKVAGWKLEYAVSGNSIKINASKNFTVYETGRKKDWQNAKKTMKATADFEISDFNVDVNNLKSFADKKSKGYIKLTCDTDIGFSLSQSLRYTPDSNRNGKFPSNWNSSRWTDSDSKGAKTIKIAHFSPSLYGVVGVDVDIYLLISVDGKISFKTSIEDGGVLITANKGKISLTKLGTKTTEISANVNLHNRLGVDAAVKIFGFINVMEYDVGADLDILASVDLYYQQKISKSGVCADEEGLNEYAANDDKFNYCIGVQIDLLLSGEMKKSGVKLILDFISKGDALNFKLSIWSGGFHFEDGNFVEKCTRSLENETELKESDNDEIELGSYKLNLDVGGSSTVPLTAIPSETMDLLDSKNSITVKSNNDDICTATYNKKNKQIIIQAIGEGSTEVIIKAKKGMWWWKKTCEQKVSVTVNPSDYMGTSGKKYIIIDPAQISKSYSL